VNVSLCDRTWFLCVTDSSTCTIFKRGNTKWFNLIKKHMSEMKKKKINLVFCYFKHFPISVFVYHVTESNKKFGSRTGKVWEYYTSRGNPIIFAYIAYLDWFAVLQKQNGTSQLFQNSWKIDLVTIFCFVSVTWSYVIMDDFPRFRLKLMENI